MAISEEDKKAHDEYIQNLTEEQMQQMVERCTVMLQEWAEKEELGSADHKFLADLAVPVGIYVLFNEGTVDASTLSVLVMSTAIAAFNYGRQEGRWEIQNAGRDGALDD